MAERADGGAPRQQLFTIATILACIAGAYVFAGAPGVQGILSGMGAPVFPAAQYWLVAFHLLATAGALSGGLWVAGLMRDLDRPGLLPLAAFAVFQFAVLIAALANIALAANIVRFQDGAALAGLALLAPAIAAMRLHPDMYMGLLRMRNWVQSAGVDLSPLRGAGLVALTIAANLVPLALVFQSLTTHMIAVLSVLFRRAEIDPVWYVQALGESATTITQTEANMAGAAGAVSLLLAALWASGRFAHQRRERRAEALATGLSAADSAFVADALPAAVDAVAARASSSRHILWSFIWYLGVTPALLVLGYWFYLAFEGLLDQHALSWASAGTSDFDMFAVTDQGYARYLVPAAFAGIAILLNRTVAHAVLPDSRFDFAAFAVDTAATLRAALLTKVAAGEIGAGRPFDAAAFVNATVRPRTWPNALLVSTLCAAAAGATVHDLGRSVLFTADGVMIRETLFAPPKLVRYDMVQAVAIDCRIDALGAKPVYELTLPDARVVDMVGATRLDERLDHYINVDRRLRFSGVGYAYPPGDLMPCLKGIEEQYNPVIAAGAARLLHVID